MERLVQRDAVGLEVLPTAALQNLERPERIVLEGDPRIIDRVLHANGGGQMGDDVERSVTAPQVV